MAQPNLRALAAKTLAPVLKKQASLSGLFDQALEKLISGERPLFQQLCFGCLRHFHELEAYSLQLLSKPLKNKDADVYALLLLGLYQLRHMRLPDHAAISETVEASKKLKKPWASKLINGVLRNYLREQKTLEQKLVCSHACQFSHPEWLITRISAAWPAQWQTILEANNQQAPLTLRVNAQQQSRDQYLAQLTAAGIACEANPLSSVAINLHQSCDVSSLPGFTQGVVSVQDIAAQQAAQLLELAPGQRVLDACAAPGGKTCHIAETENNLKSLLAIDLEASRMQRVEQNLHRLQLNAQLKVADVGQLAEWWDGEKFDRILLDAPCSATGVIRRHPDIKILRREADIAQLTRIQTQLLATLWSTLAEGGILLYATCSILPDENQHIIHEFLCQHDDAQALSFALKLGVSVEYGQQLFPQINGNDGFYYAKLRKCTATR